MTITLEIPEELAAQLGNSRQELSRHALEVLVLEAHREDRIGSPQAAELLGLSRLKWNHFLKEKQVMEHADSVEAL